MSMRMAVASIEDDRVAAVHGARDEDPRVDAEGQAMADAGHVDDEVGSQPSPVRLLLGDTRSQILRMRGLTRLE